MARMEDTTTTTTKESASQRARSPELVRPVRGRMLAGVAQGVADNFGIHPWIPRVFFIVTAFMGGLGVALYAAGWAFIRGEDESESAADRFFSGATTSRSWIGIGLMIVAGIIVLSNFTFLSGEVVWSLAFLIVGLLLYLGYIPIGTARREADHGSGESKEGVQQMTETDAPPGVDAPAGDSPAGGAAAPPPVPTPTPPNLTPREPRETSILGRLTIGVMLLGLGVLALLDNIDALAVDARPRHYMALAVTILGVGLLVGTIVGRARWLILLALVTVPTLIFSPAFEYDWRSNNFDRQVAPLVFEEIEGSYSQDVGTLILDLRHLPWNGEEVQIDASVDAGQLMIFIPDGVGIVGSASVDIGRVSEPGRSSAGLGEPSLEWNDVGELGTVRLDADVNIGNIEIHPQGR
jgi:phage shock protein PspC (stress-responsive transcriptional regulator)